MQAALQIDLSHHNLSAAEKESRTLTPAQRDLISAFDRCSFGGGVWQHERVQSGGETIDAFTIEIEERRLLAARTQAITERGGKQRTVDHFVVAEFSENGLGLAVHRHQVAKRLCADVYARTLPHEELPDFAYPSS